MPPPIPSIPPMIPLGTSMPGKVDRLHTNGGWPELDGTAADGQAILNGKTTKPRALNEFMEGKSYWSNVVKFS